MNRIILHFIVFVFAVSLAFSALYMFFERDEFTNVFYGSTSQLLIPQNSNVTLPLGQVSDRYESNSLTINLESWTPLLSWNRSSSIRQPLYYNVEAYLLISIEVNKSAFVLLEDFNFESNRNNTVEARAFHSTNFPPNIKETEGQTIECKMELDHIYQLKIGNYETFIKNQTGPLQFTTQNTNKSLELVIGKPSSEDIWGPPNFKITITFTREPNLYLISGLLILDAALIAAYSVKQIQNLRETTEK